MFEKLADFAGEVFRKADKGRENIRTVFEPRPGRKK
jgi:hypothetical protein